MTGTSDCTCKHTYYHLAIVDVCNKCNKEKGAVRREYPVKCPSPPDFEHIWYYHAQDKRTFCINCFRGKPADEYV